MSAFANAGTGYPSVKFSTIGDAVAGKVISMEDYQETHYDGPDKGKPKFYSKSQDPVMAVKVVLETRPGDESSRVTLFAQGAKMIAAIANAFRAQGRQDITVGDELAVTFTGYDGRAKTYAAAYALAESVPF